MSSFNRRLLLAALPAALVACGFTPVYAPGGTGATLQGKIAFDTPDTEETYLLIRNLEERLGRSGAPDFHLTVKPVLTRQGQAITAAGDTTRISIVGAATYSLRRIATDTEVAAGNVRNFTGYSATGSTVETVAAETDAKERLMVILADQITTELLTNADLKE